MLVLEDWKATFRMIELSFFRREPDDWPEVFQSKLEDLDENYGDRHEGHVLILNERLHLFPPLRENHFNGGIRVRDLQRDFVEPRIHGRPLAMQKDGE
jgi:hypothetical protein